MLQGARRSTKRRALYSPKMSEPKGRLIAICMLVGAVAMIGLALSGTLQITAFRPPVVADVVAR